MDLFLSAIKVRPAIAASSEPAPTVTEVTGFGSLTVTSCAESAELSSSESPDCTGSSITISSSSVIITSSYAISVLPKTYPQTELTCHSY